MINEPSRRGRLEMTDAVCAEMRALVSGAQYAALACLAPEDGHPIVSRVGLASLADGSPLIFISALATHTTALRSDQRCSLLIGEPGKGDALAHPRLSLKCRAEMMMPEGQETGTARQRYLAAHPKARLYIDLPDFRFFKLDIASGSFNGGFGRAYDVQKTDLIDATGS